MDNHLRIRPIISIYLDNEATPEEVKLVREHLAGCPSCRKYAEELRTLSSVLKAWPDEDLSPDLEQKINTNLLAGKSKESPMKTEFRLSRFGAGAGALASIIVAVLCFQQYSKSTLQARFRDASLYERVAMTSGARPQLPHDEKVMARESQARKEDQSFLANLKSAVGVIGTARMKSATDDIGDQYLPGEKNKEAKIALAKKDIQYEPYYLQSNYAVDKMESVSAPASVSGGMVAEGRVVNVEQAFGGQRAPNEMVARRQIAGGFQSSNYNGITSDSEAWEVSPIQSVPIDQPGKDVLDGRYNADFNTENYDRIYENPFLQVKENPLSTFSIDVDTASYSNIRRFLNAGQVPPPDAVRIEEMINYFSYDYPQPEEGKPFSITTEVAKCPWNPKHDLVMVGLKGKELKTENLPSSNLVFLIDVSGSMDQPNKLPLVKSGIKLLVNQLRENDRVSMVVYAGAAGLVLDSTSGYNKDKIIAAIDNLQAGGSTAGGAGIKLAYEIAKKNLIQSGNNRVILATDGDFNVGTSSDGDLVRLIEENRDQGVFLSILGFGIGNYKDSKMEKLADKGNGNYAYIDTIEEAKKVLVNEMGATLFTIAKDVKIQIEFNPAKVKAFRLIGYENRILAKEDFNDDKKDAGEMGAGHEVTALYELVGPDEAVALPGVDQLQYQETTVKESQDLLTVKLRYKEPEGTESKLLSQKITAGDVRSADGVSQNFKFASAVAEFGLLLRGSEHKGAASYLQVLERARQSTGEDKWGYRTEFLKLVEKAGLVAR